MIRTQFYSEEIDAEGGMFPPARLALMQGSHGRRYGPEAGKVYALLLDLAGEDEGAGDRAAGYSGGQGIGEELQNPGRDSTALTVVEVDLDSLADELIKAPTYRVVDRRLWVGTKHTLLYAQLKALGELWGPRWWVLDATGVGAGMASFLDKAFPNVVLPFLFNGPTKSKLGWDFLAVIETGRYKEYAEPAATMVQPHEQKTFWQQLSYCQMEIIPGPERRMKWGVPDGTRDAATGDLVHDDLILSAALCAVLDGLEWGLAESAVVAGVDPLKGLGDVY
jgi:hypothetical protein